MASQASSNSEQNFILLCFEYYYEFMDFNTFDMFQFVTVNIPLDTKWPHLGQWKSPLYLAPDSFKHDLRNLYILYKPQLTCFLPRPRICYYSKEP